MTLEKNKKKGKTLDKSKKTKPKPTEVNDATEGMVVENVEEKLPIEVPAEIEKPAYLKKMKNQSRASSELEITIAQALYDLETNSDLKEHLRELNITKAKEIEFDGRKAIVVYVPMPQLKFFQKIQVRLVRELEKKFSGKHVLFLGDRVILPKHKQNSRMKLGQKRPQSRTLTSVFDCTLEDLLFPSEVVGKRIRIKSDGKRLYKVHLDKNQQTNVEHKVDTIIAVYKKLTGREMIIEFREPIF